MGFIQIFTFICMGFMAVGIIMVFYRDIKIRDENDLLKEEVKHFKEEERKLSNVTEVLEESNKSLTEDRNTLECENETLEERIEELKTELKINEQNGILPGQVGLEEVELIEKEDMLISLFEMQKNLQKKFYTGYLPADEPKIMGENILALVAELGEVMQEDKRWKSWCKNPPEVIQQKKKEEIIDCIHFVINICIYSGMDAKELYTLFTNKNIVNIKRQESDY
jgi:DNA-binding transcriptional MerR regulator